MQNKGCITCKKCEQVRLNFYCGRKKLSQKQLYNKYGFCTRYEPVEQKPQTNEDWFCSLPTEEKARFIADNDGTIQIGDEAEYQNTITKWSEWLKQPHKE